MIRITRWMPEPAKLAAARERGLAALAALGLPQDRAAWPRSLRKELPSNPRAETLPTIHAMQRSKCCYCEAIDVPRNLDVEHYRPIAHYPWLGWTWSNLLAACRACNQGGGKLDEFPLTDESRRLTLSAEPPGEEAPLVIDPSDPLGVDPRDHIRFVFDDQRDRFVPEGRSIDGRASVRGSETIRVLGLAHDDHIERYELHVDQHVKPAVERLREAVEGDPALIVRVWERDCLALIVPTRPFRALSEDALRYFVKTYPTAPTAVTDVRRPRSPAPTPGAPPAVPH